jgi:2-oxo-4-hydroxy-4-carboxy-5-ureidoimidazoline decarboxylase
VALAELNALEEDEFVARLGAVFEHSPWVAERCWRKRPFGSIEELHRAMMSEILQAQFDEQLALVRAHPELAGREAGEGRLTAHSSSEQERLGFTSLDRKTLDEMKRLNQSYRERFGFPCVVALRLHATRESVMGEMERRLANDAPTELRNAIEQIGHIARGRLEKIAG